MLGGQAKSRKKALQIASELFSEKASNIEAFDILKTLILREQLGSTAIGHGIALPHGRLTTLEKPQAVVLVLENGVDFYAPDKEPVDIFFCLIVPFGQDYEQIVGLNELIESFKDKVLRAQIRNAHNHEALYNIFCKTLQLEQQEVEA